MKRKYIPLIAAALLALLAVSFLLWRSGGTGEDSGTGEESPSAVTDEAEEPDTADADDEAADTADDEAADTADEEEPDTADEEDEEAESPADDSAGEDTGEAEIESPGTDEEGNPIVADTACLTIGSVYTASILNPDCGGDYAEEIAALEISNDSDTYLLRAELTATMSDGTRVTFVVTDLPAGATAEVFDTENQSLPSGVSCTAVTSLGEEFASESDVLWADGVTATQSGSDVVITNTTDQTLETLRVVYRCNMDGQYIGGISYEITIEGLAPGESFTVTDDSLMGEVAVVRIY